MITNSSKNQKKKKKKKKILIHFEFATRFSDVSDWVQETPL